MISALEVAIDMRGEAVELGHARFLSRRGHVSTTFHYASAWLSSDRGFAIDPQFARYDGAHHTAGLPGAFADAAPDRWGRNLIAKREQARAAAAGVRPRTLNDVDYLVGVSDLTRQGALRFRAGGDQPFLAEAADIPPLIELPRLLRAAERVTHDGDDASAVKELLDAGSASLGGARPKASVRESDSLMIAKFPHSHDHWDVMAWEMTVLDLAERAGLPVPKHRLVRINGKACLLVERFDRSGRDRLPYVSGMTLLGGVDGEAHDYLDVAQGMAEFVLDVRQGLRDLWRRIAFSLAVNNTDDHLRNHGFLRSSPRGWRLSPVFDINPNPDLTAERVTAVGGARARHDALASLFAYAAEFELTHVEAEQIWANVVEGTRVWRSVARGQGISESECHRFAPVFEPLWDAH